MQRSASSKIEFCRSVFFWPSACARCAVIIESLVPMIAMSRFQKFDVNLGSRSLMMTFGNPWWWTTTSKNSLAICGASVFVCIAAYLGRFVSLSTTVIMPSKPLDTGGTDIKFIETTSQQSFRTGMGISLPFFFSVIVFHRAQVPQLKTYLRTSFYKFVQQYHCAKFSCVWHIPGCAAVFPS